MWVNPVRIGEDSEPLVRFFRNSNSADTHAGGLRKEPGFRGPRWTAAGRWDTTTNADPYADVQARHIDQDRWDKPQAGRGGQDLTWSPDAVLTDTVARLRRNLDEMKAESRLSHCALQWMG